MDLPDGGKHRAPVTQPVSAPEHHGNGGDYRAPTTLVEQILAGICAGVLGVDRVGVDESFFHLGGDSLSAMRAVAAINTALDTNLAVTTIFDAPSVRSLSEQLDRHAGPTTIFKTRLSPHTWRQAIANLLGVLAVSRQLFPEQLLLVANARGEHDQAR